ncbi:MAG: 4-alpha-glucanotransferase [Flavisolibacter sp.]
MRIDFYLRFQTKFGETLALVGNNPALGNDDVQNALLLTYLNNEFWHASIDIDSQEQEELHYRYIFHTEDGKTILDGEKQRTLELKKLNKDVSVMDAWNDEGFFENAFSTAPFAEVYFKGRKKVKAKKPARFTHQFRVKAPLLQPDETVCLLGSVGPLHNWNLEKPILLQKTGAWFTVSLDLEAEGFPLFYKYGIYNLKKETFTGFEDGDNRVLHESGGHERITILHDGFLRLPNNTWKGAGIAIPVFSLRSQNGFGVGEFADLKLLVDWAKQTGLKLIQILPINDTSATNTWMDSYPYAAISAFALHPMYINLEKLAGKKNAAVVKALSKKKKQLNELAEIDYEQVTQFKTSVLRELYEAEGKDFLKEEGFQSFFEDNKYWLVPYAAFCYLRDKYGTCDYAKWKTHSSYNEAEIERLVAPKSRAFSQVAFYYFTQYHLHLQLSEAVDYAHKNGIALKGDIPIGIYRYGADAWRSPELYNMDMQAGAPPDDFTIKGQNWGFPTYNWQKMEEDHFEWWRQRFHQMSHYFDAFRIDHILGFFRIWSIPMDAVEGIFGRFIPALPVTAYEFGERGIWFDHDRFCKPWITDSIVEETFGGAAEFVKQNLLVPNNRGGYDLKPEVDTQRKVDAYLAERKDIEEKDALRSGLFDLLSNVILFERAGTDQKEYDFRILIDLTSSYHHLDDATKGKVWDLYIDYFYRRQDGFWEKEAMKKLPALKNATNMLVCGEDLGMVPHSVPDVMNRLGILSLEVQRMPKDPKLEFFHPQNAPYLSVVTPSTHDMSTIRAWWEEDRQRTQHFYNHVLGEQGTAPYFCEPWINRAIVLQHLYSPAMWSIFQLQDILGMSLELRRQLPAEERINNPANPNYYWNYRMHISLEQLVKEKAFNNELKDYIENSGRS